MTPAWGAPGRRRPWSAVVRAEILVVLALLVSGLILGGVWALAAPHVAEAADPGESRIAVDGLLALLQLGAGLVTAVVLVVVPGRDHTVRFVTALVGSAGGGLLAYAVGAARGVHLHAPGAALVWPLVVAVLTTLRLLAGMLFSPDGDAGLRGGGA
jgi:hypothetical protein